VSYSDDGSDWDALADRGHPVLATAIGAAVLLIVTLTGRYAAGWQDGTAYRLGYAAGGALAIWLVAYLVTLRKARPLWKLASFVTLFAVALAAGTLRLRPPDAAMPLRADTRDTARQLEQVLARPDQPPDRVEPGRGPISQMSAAILNGALADRRAFEAEAEAAGLNQVIGASAITRSSAVLDRCEALGALAARAHHYGGRWQVHHGDARRIGEAAVRENRLPARFLDDFLTGAASDSGNYVRTWALTADSIHAAIPLCRILARRRWTLEGQRLTFDNDGDLSDYNRHLARLQRVNAERDRMDRAAEASTRAEIARMSR
jgi:hypothetical protein